jgi:hypothetical protein
MGDIMRLSVRLVRFPVLMALLPEVIAAQTGPIDRLREVLPIAVAEDVITVIEDAASRHLPANALARRVLEAHAKGKPNDDLLPTTRLLEAELRVGREAVEAGGREPQANEIEAAATARAMGADPQSITALAAATSAEHSLVIPLTILGTLVSGGLSSADALKAVENNADLIGRRGLAGGRPPAEVNQALGAANAGPPTAGGSVSHPSGPPRNVPANSGVPGSRPQHPGTPNR